MLEFRILGPIEVVRDGRSLSLGGARQRALVADLALHANEVISADRLIDDLWGDEPPETAAHLVHVYISRLRKALEGDGQPVLLTRPPGYVLRLEPPDRIDADRFETEARRAVELMEGRPAEALAAIDAALECWRGRALEEFADEAFAQPAIARLDELRQVTLEHRVEVLLSLGRLDEGLVELEGSIARFPLRERLRELKMLALYRAGRQADALAAYQAARRTLSDELGVDPGPGLAALEQAILRHDPELRGPPVEPTAVPGEPPPPAEPRPPTEPETPAGTRLAPVDRPSPVRGARRPAHRRRRRVGATLIALVAGAVLVGSVSVLTLRDGAAERPSPSARPGETGSPSSTPSPSVTGPVGSVTGVEWSEVPDPGGAVFGGPGDQVLQGGAVTSDGVIAVGHSAVAGDIDAAVWTGSPSGPWSRVSDPAFMAPGSQEATDAVMLPHRVVVVGSDASGGDHDAAVWTLERGATTWRRIRPDAQGLDEPGDQWVRAVTWTGTRVIAVGVSQVAEDDDAAIWVSRDARDWTLIVPGSLGAPGDQQMTSVKRFRRRVVAAGWSATTEGRDAAVWLSREGTLWEPIESDALGGPGDQQINSLVAFDPLLVAVGEETIGDDRNAVVWVSGDGRHWSRVPDEAGVLGGAGSQQISSVVALGGLLVAAGTETSGTETDAAVWTSADGTSWARSSPTSPGMSTLADYGAQWVRALLATEREILALGREGRADDDGDIWIGRPAS